MFFGGAVRFDDLSQGVDVATGNLSQRLRSVYILDLANGLIHQSVELFIIGPRVDGEWADLVGANGGGRSAFQVRKPAAGGLFVPGKRRVAVDIRLFAGRGLGGRSFFVLGEDGIARVLVGGEADSLSEAFEQGRRDVVLLLPDVKKVPNLCNVLRALVEERGGHDHVG